jgi:predicted branched-subunit amino acid permease
VAAVLLNLRYLPIGASVAPYLTGGRLRRLLTAQLIVDESWAISARPGGRFAGRVLIGAGIVLWVAWVLGTAVGVIGGGALGDPRRLGLDAAFPALFLALLAPQLRRRPALSAAVLGAGIALGLVPWVPAGLPIVAASAAALIGLARSP